MAAQTFSSASTLSQKAGVLG